MEPRRYSGNSHWYHETRASYRAEQAPRFIPKRRGLTIVLLGLQQQGDAPPRCFIIFVSRYRRDRRSACCCCLTA